MGSDAVDYLPQLILNADEHRLPQDDIEAVDLLQCPVDIFLLGLMGHHDDRHSPFDLSPLLNDGGDADAGSFQGSLRSSKALQVDPSPQTACSRASPPHPSS